MKMTQQDFDQIRNLVYDYAGLYFSDNKLDYVERRVLKRMKELDMQSIRDYIRFLHFDRTRHELEELTNLLITYETYFFRHYEQLQVFAEEVLPEIEKKRETLKQINILSAGCSTGDEPYTLAIIAREMIHDVSQWNIHIDAVDINRHLLQKAVEGSYSMRAIREVPEEYLKKYFSWDGSFYKLSPEIKQLVHFSRVNLFSDFEMRTLGDFYDVIFCRNVLIYFDKDSATKVLNTFYEKMNHGGYIFLGSAESVGRFSNLFQLVKLRANYFYKKA